MSIVIHYENGKLIRAEMPTARKTPSPTFACSDGKTFAVGDIWGKTFEEVSQIDWIHQPELLNSIEGAKAIAYADADRCVFTVDMNGIDSFYYYCRNGCFVLSDSFWAVVRIVQPKYEDLNKMQIKKELLSASVVGDCAVLGMRFLLPNHIGVYDAKSQTCRVSRYGETFHYTGEVTSVEEAVSHMDAILHHAMDCIKEKGGEAPYGMGLSGGLDSRLIPYYALKHGISIEAFNTCVSRPHGVLKARSIVSAEALARHFRIPFWVNEWNKKTLAQKQSLVLRLLPGTQGGSAFKYEDEGLPSFMTMINGGSGMIVGSELPSHIEEMTEDDLLSAMKTEFLPSTTSTFRMRAVRAISYITGILLWAETADYPPFFFLDEAVRQSVEEDLRQYISSRKKDGLSNLDIFEDYFINVVGCHNRLGAHKSLLGQKRAFSIYIPFLLKETLRWNAELLEGRAVLNALIREKIPDCARIKEESFKTSIGAKTSVFRRICSVAGFLLRGNGTAIDQHYMPQHDVMRRYLRFINKESGTWFKQVFGLQRPVTMAEPKREQSRSNICIWQTAILLHCLETKQYMEWED